MTGDWRCGREKTSLGGQFSVPAAEKQQRRDLFGVGVHDFAEVDRVVAGVVRLKDATLDVTHRVVEDRAADVALAVSDTVELLDAAGGEAARDRLLLLG